MLLLEVGCLMFISATLMTSGLKPDGDGDWLRLAYRRIESPEGVTQDPKPGNWRVGYNQVAGAVFITRQNNSELLDQTNREGLVDGEAFAHLRVFAEATVRFLELNHQDFEMSRKPGPSARDAGRCSGRSPRPDRSRVKGRGGRSAA